MSVFKRLDRAVEALLKTPVSARAMAITRMVVGYTAWFEATQNVSRIGQYTPGQLHLPYGVEFNWSADQLHALCEWQMRFAFALVLGIFSRFFALATFACQASFFLVSQLNFRNHIYLMLILLLLLSFAHADRRFSVRSLVRKLLSRLPRLAQALRLPRLAQALRLPRLAQALRLPRLAQALRLPRLAQALKSADPQHCAVLPARLIQAQVLIIYFYSGLHKLLLGFGSGFPLCRFLGRELPRGRSGRDLDEAQLTWITDHMSREGCPEAIPAFILIGSIGTIITELGFSLGFGFRRSVWISVVVGVGLHASIWWAMDVVTFGLMMVATYPLFVASPPLSAVRNEVKATIGAKN